MFGTPFQPANNMEKILFVKSCVKTEPVDFFKDVTLGQRMHLTLEARMTNTVFISYGLFTGLTYQLSK
jgi:hypothetical protein